MGRSLGLPWWLLSKFSPARRIALVAVAAFEVWEVIDLMRKGFQHQNWIALGLGLVVLVLLLGFELAEHVARERDHELAQEISEWLLPHTPPSLRGVEIAFGRRMANHVASDYYNVFPRWVDATRDQASGLFIVMADVAGSGLQGALIMATFQASLRALADSRLPLCDLASQMNQWTWDRSLQGRHFTMAFLADLHPETGTLEYVSAGHQPPLIRRVNGTTESLDVGGFPFGALAGSSYDMGSAVMEPGDYLVVFTDGVIRAENHHGEEYGEERLVHTLRTARGSSANEIANQLRTSMLSFCGAASQPDDLSFVVVRRV